jgi:hypothetical protein
MVRRTGLHEFDRLSGLEFTVPGFSPRGPGFDSWIYQFFGVVMGMERGPLSLVRIFKEVLE